MTDQLLDRLSKELGDVMAMMLKAKVEMERLEAENSRLRAAIGEMLLPPYADSDLRSLVRTINARARAALEDRSE